MAQSYHAYRRRLKHIECVAAAYIAIANEQHGGRGSLFYQVRRWELLQQAKRNYKQQRRKQKGVG